MTSTYNRHLLSDFRGVIIIKHTSRVHISDSIVLTDDVLWAELTTLDNTEVRIPIRLRVIVLTSVKWGCQNHTCWLIQATTTKVLRRVVIELIPVFSLYLMRPLIIAILERNLGWRMRIFVFTSWMYETHFLNWGFMVFNTGERYFWRNETPAIDALIILTHEFVLLLGHIVTNSLVMSIMSWFLIYWVLDAIDVILDRHMLVIPVAFTRSIAIVWVFHIEIYSLVLGICYVTTWLFVSHVYLLTHLSCLILCWICITLSRRRFFKRGIIWDFWLFKARTWSRVYVLVMEPSLRIFSCLHMIAYLLWRDILSNIRNWVSRVVLNPTDVLIRMVTLWTIAVGESIRIYHWFFRLWRDGWCINSIDINCLLNLLIEHYHFPVSNLILPLRWQVLRRQHLLSIGASLLHPVTWHFFAWLTWVALSYIWV